MGLIARYAVFDNLAAYTAWHDALNVQPDVYDKYIVSLIDPQLDVRVIVKIDSKIDETGLTVWNSKTAIDNGFVNPESYVASKIKKAKIFGEQLIIEVGAENIALGLTREEIAQMSSDMFQIQMAVQSGSLLLARDLLAAFQPTAYLTQARRDKYIAKMDAFLVEL